MITTVSLDMSAIGALNCPCKYMSIVTRHMAQGAS